jgi:glycosyltransferase involved in cell wall biosynthesis
MGEPPAPIHPEIAAILQKVRGAFDAADPAAALEWIAGVAAADIQRHRATMLSCPQRLWSACNLYTSLFRGLGIESAHPFELDAHTNNARPSILFVAQCIARGQAASENMVRHTRAMADLGWRVGLLVADELTQRDPPLEYFQTPDGPSERLGKGILERIAHYADIHILAKRGTFLDAIEEGVNVARRWRPSVAAFVASPACPVQAGMIFSRVAPRQAALSVGVPLLLPGVDHVIYNSPRRLAADAAMLALTGISASSVTTSGGDAAAGLTTAPADRAVLGVPADAPLLVSASNVLPKRMLAGTFAADLARFLTEHPRAHWLALGKGDFTAVKAALGPAADRARFPGPVGDIRPFVKAADVFLNEYPEGGGNSVIEAMGCGTPVLAMNAGPAHGCHIGADLVGDDAIPAFDPGAYWAKASAWLADRVARRAAGLRQQRRALDHLDHAVIAAKYAEELTGMLVPISAAA